MGLNFVFDLCDKHVKLPLFEYLRIIRSLFQNRNCGTIGVAQRRIYWGADNKVWLKLLGSTARNYRRQVTKPFAGLALYTISISEIE